jgi:hypothetical protein
MPHLVHTYSDPFLNHLFEIMVSAMTEPDLVQLGIQLGLNPDQMQDMDKKAKAHAIIDHARQHNRIHDLAQSVQLSSGESAIKHLPNQQPDAVGTQEPKSRKEKRLERRKKFLRSFFPGQPIAQEDMLCSSWEIIPTQWLHKFLPKFVSGKITRLPRILDTVSFLPNKQGGTSITKKPAGQSAAQEWNSAYRPLLNFHAIRYWYYGVRDVIGPIFVLAYLFFLIVLALSIMGVVAFVLGATGFISSFSLISNSYPGLAYTTTQPGNYVVEVRDPRAADPSYLLSIMSAKEEIIEIDFSTTGVSPIL